VNGYDLDNPLRVDCCDVCDAVNWRECICDPTRPRRKPTEAELERARRARLTRSELASEAGERDV
jgi:formylglycine-generating enzyme required for sulfatase activity